MLVTAILIGPHGTYREVRGVYDVPRHFRTFESHNNTVSLDDVDVDVDAVQTIIWLEIRTHHRDIKGNIYKFYALENCRVTSRDVESVVRSLRGEKRPPEARYPCPECGKRLTPHFEQDKVVGICCNGCGAMYDQALR